MTDAIKLLERDYGLHPGHRDVIEIANVGRDELAEFVHKLGLKVGVEVGVAAGEYSDVLARANPQMKLYGVDPHESYPTYKDYVKESTFNNMLDSAHHRLDRFPNYEFIRKYSLDAAKDFEDGSLDFVYIDANHAEPYVSQDINAWAEKVRAGGIVSGHDYARIRGNDNEDSKNWAVIPAIHKYCDEHGYQLYIWGLNGKNGLKRDSSRSWMFVKK